MFLISDFRMVQRCGADTRKTRKSETASSHLGEFVLEVACLDNTPKGTQVGPITPHRGQTLIS